jgi:hypothetical protein
MQLSCHFWRYRYLPGSHYIPEVNTMRKNNIRSYAMIAVCAGSIGLASQTRAQLIAYEGFDTNVGPLTGQSGSTSIGWDSPWDDNGGDPFNAVTTGLQSPSTTNTVAPGSLESPANPSVDSRADRFLSFSLPLVNDPFVTGTHTYFSFLEKGMENASALFRLKIQNVSIDANFNGLGGISAELTGAPGSAGIINPTNSTNPILIVGEFIITDASTNTYTLNLFTPSDPNSVSSLNLLSSTTASLFGSPHSGSGSVFVYSYQGSPSFSFDELRIGSTLDSVYNTAAPVPEPATLAVLALGAFGALRKRRSS